MKHSGLKKRLADVERKISDPVKLKWLLNPSKKKARKWKKRGYTVLAIRIRKPVKGEYTNVKKGGRE